MKRILLSALASVALSCGTTSESSAHAGPHGEHGPRHHEHHMHHEKKHPAKTADEMAKECEERMEKIKDTGASLPPKMKAKFDYNLKKASVEIEALKNPDMDERHKHADLCHRDLKAAEQIVKKHEHQAAHEKKMEEKKPRQKSVEQEQRNAKPKPQSAKLKGMRNVRLEKQLMMRLTPKKGTTLEKVA